MQLEKILWSGNPNPSLLGCARFVNNYKVACVCQSLNILNIHRHFFMLLTSVVISFNFLCRYFESNRCRVVFEWQWYLKNVCALSQRVQCGFVLIPFWDTLKLVHYFICVPSLLQSTQSSRGNNIQILLQGRYGPYIRVATDNIVQQFWNNNLNI